MAVEPEERFLARLIGEEELERRKREIPKGLEPLYERPPTDPVLADIWRAFKYHRPLTDPNPWNVMAHFLQGGSLSNAIESARKDLSEGR